MGAAGGQAGESLGELRRAITASDKLGDADKRDLVVDVDTLQAQLARPTPDRTIVERLWDGINRAASVAGLAQAAVQVAPWIQKLLGS